MMMMMIDSNLIARFDAFANEFMRDESRDSMIAMICAHSSNLNIDDAIIDMIDAQFDDAFAIICDDDANNESIYIEFIECNRNAFIIYFIARIHQMIA
jgi:hypothetical protein